MSDNGYITAKRKKMSFFVAGVDFYACYPSQSAVPSVMERFDAASSYHAYIVSDRDSAPAEAENCLAVRLCSFIAATADGRECSHDRGCLLPDEYYSVSADSFISQCSSHEKIDHCLADIYLRQMAMIMKVCGLIEKSKGRVKVSSFEGDRRLLYCRLMRTFWNDVEWKELFPSDHELAELLQRDRSIFRDVLLRRKKAQVQEVANDFSELTGVARKNDLFFASFIDFYLLTWLGHFNMVDYYGGVSSEPVAWALTDAAPQVFGLLD